MLRSPRVLQPDHSLPSKRPYRKSRDTWAWEPQPALGSNPLTAGENYGVRDGEGLMPRKRGERGWGLLCPRTSNWTGGFQQLSIYSCVLVPGTELALSQHLNE